jgi:outer membrane protein
MRGRIAAATLFVAMALAPGSARGEEAAKIGCVDVQKVLHELPELKPLYEAYEQKVKEFRTKLEEMEKGIGEKEKRLEEELLLLTNEEKQRRRDEVEALKEEKRNFLKESSAVLEPDKKMIEKTGEEIFEERVRPAIERLGQRDGYTMLLLTPNPFVLYNAPTTDITQQVLTELGR